MILTGDLNDTVQAATTQLLLGPPGSEIGTAGFTQPDQGDHQRLWNLAPLMPPGRDYSRINHGRNELIDHILVSAPWSNRSKPSPSKRSSSNNSRPSPKTRMRAETRPALTTPR